MREHSRLILMIGLAGSGKSTYARRLWQESPDTTLRVCMDEIIQMTSFYDFKPHLRPFYQLEERTILVRGLTFGLDVIVDRTNLEATTRAYYIEIGKNVRKMANHLLSSLPDSTDLFGSNPHIDIESILKNLSDEAQIPALYMEAFSSAYRRYVQQGADLLFKTGLPPDFKSLLKLLSKLRITGVFLDVPFEVCLKRRLKSPDRLLRESIRSINWREVLEKMVVRLERPSMDEGFDDLIFLNENFEPVIDE